MRDNPFRTLRLTLGLSQKWIAEQLNITSQVVLRNEQGLYTTPNVHIASILIETYNHQAFVGPVAAGVTLPPTFASLNTDYRAWVLDLRRENGHIFSKPITFKLGVAPQTHPFKIWRESFGFSRIGFCKLLALHPSIVQSYEEGSSGSLPEAIYTALVDARIPSSVIDELIARCSAYSEWVNSNKEIPSKYVRDSDLLQTG